MNDLSRPERLAAPAGVLEAALALSEDAHVLVDAAGRIEWFDARFAALTGHDAASALGAPLLELLRGPPTDAGQHAALVAALAAGRGFGRCELCHVRRSGEAFRDRLAARPVGEGRGVVVALRDVSPAHAAAREHERLAALLDMAQEVGRLGIWERAIPFGEGRWDRHMRRIFGLAEDAPTPDLEGLARLHADEPAMRHYLGSTQRAGRYERRYRIALPDSTPRHVHSVWQVENDAAGAPARAVGIVVDDTETWALAERVDRTSAQLRLAVEVGVWTYRPATGETEWNEQMWSLSGLSPDEAAVGPESWIARSVHPDDRARVLDESRRWLKEKRPSFETEMRILHPDGSVRWVVNRSRFEKGPQGTVLYGIMLDTTERHRAQHALRSADERAALAARGVGIGTWERNEKTGEARWDEQMFRLRGIEPQPTTPDAAGRVGFALPQDIARVHAAHARALSSLETVSYEYRVRWPDGSVHWLAARAMPLFDAEGVVERLIGVNWDITEARTADDARRERELARRESQAKSQFLARMSHELRTPLNAVLGFAQLLLAEEDRPGQRARLGHIRTGGEHLLALIDEVLDLSSLEAGQVKLDIGSVPLDEVAGEALAMVERLAREREVAIDRGALAGRVLADRTRLRQVLINLLSNAIKYNRAGGRVALRGGPLDSDPGRVAICITDTGRGMSAEQVAHLFEPFNRLGAEREGIEGSGIGLVIVKVLLERMDGSIAVASEPGVGSRFELRLPGATQDAAGRRETTSASPRRMRAAAPARRGRLLYIEDNAVNALLVAELVAQRPGLVLDCEPDGERGVARALAERPDLVLIDMQLPDMDGHEVLRRLRVRGETASIPCIALSANAMTEDIERALAAGFADYWTKPIDLQAFLRGLDALFDVEPTNRSG